MALLPIGISRSEAAQKAVARLKRAMGSDLSPQNPKGKLFRYQATPGKAEFSIRGGTFYSVGTPMEEYREMSGSYLVTGRATAKNPLVVNHPLAGVGAFEKFEKENPKIRQEYQNLMKSQMEAQREAIRTYPGMSEDERKEALEGVSAMSEDLMNPESLGGLGMIVGRISAVDPASKDFLHKLGQAAGIPEEDIQKLFEQKAPYSHGYSFMDRIGADAAKAAGHDAIITHRTAGSEGMFFGLTPEASQPELLSSLQFSSPATTAITRTSQRNQAQTISTNMIAPRDRMRRHHSTGSIQKNGIFG